MDQGKAVVVASAIIGGCLLAQTGYTLVHDRSIAAAERQEKDRLAKVEKESITKLKAKAAWDRATKSLDTDLGSWLNEQGKSEKGRYIFIRWAWVKSYALSDITWADPKHITVKGYIIAAPESLESKTYSWSRSLVWLDDDSWGAKTVTFAVANLPKNEKEEMFQVNIKHPTF